MWPKNQWKLREIAIILSGENGGLGPQHSPNFSTIKTWPKNQWKLREIAIISSRKRGRKNQWKLREIAIISSRKRGRKTRGNYVKSPLFRSKNVAVQKPTNEL